MTALLGWLVNVFWPAVWGNLAASVIWVPVGWAGGALTTHLIVGWHHARLHARLDRHGVAR